MRYWGPIGAAAAGYAVGRWAWGEGVQNLPEHLQLLEQQQELAAMGIDPKLLWNQVGPSDSTPDRYVSGPLRARGGDRTTAPVQSRRYIAGRVGADDQSRALALRKFNNQLARTELTGTDLGYSALQMGQIRNQLLRSGGGLLQDLTGGQVTDTAAAQRMGIGPGVTGAFRFAQRRGGFGDTDQPGSVQSFMHLFDRMGFRGMGEVVPELERIAGILEGFRSSGIPIAGPLARNLEQSSALFGPVMGRNIALGTTAAGQRVGQTGPQDMFGMFAMRQAFKKLGIKATKGVSAEDYERALDYLAENGVDTKMMLSDLGHAGGGGATGRLLARFNMSGQGIPVGGRGFRGGLKRLGGVGLSADEQVALKAAGVDEGYTPDPARQSSNWLEEVAKGSVAFGQRGKFAPGKTAPLVKEAEIKTKQIVSEAATVLTAAQDFRAAVTISKDTWAKKIAPMMQEMALMFERMAKTMQEYVH